MKINISLSSTWRKAVKVATATLFAVAVVAVGWFACDWYRTPAWPDFAQHVGKESNAGEPKILVVLKRDYAYHTGDLVKVHVFLKQKPQTLIDLKTLAVIGDFELVEKSSAQKKLDDGSIVYRVDLTVQSLKVAPKVVFTSTISWKAEATLSTESAAGQANAHGAVAGAKTGSAQSAAKRHDLTIPATPIFTSNTYDGRLNLMEGDNPRVSTWWYGGRHMVPLVVSSILFLVLLVGAIKAYLRSRIKPEVVDRGRARAVEILAAIESGSCSKAEHLELDGLVRQRFKTGPVPASQLNAAIVPGWLTLFLKLNEPAVYAQVALDEEGKARLFSQGQIVLSYWE